jgi:hypothetical protein
LAIIKAYIDRVESNLPLKAQLIQVNWKSNQPNSSEVDLNIVSVFCIVISEDSQFVEKLNPKDHFELTPLQKKVLQSGS